MAARSWTRQAVLTTAAAWTWTPYDAKTRAGDHATVVTSAGRAVVHRAEPAAHMSTAELIGHVRGLAPDAATLVWATHDATVPADLADALAALGAERGELLDVIAYEFAFGLPDVPVPADIDVRRVDTPEHLEEVYPVTATVFDQPEASPEFRRAEAAELVRQVDAGADREFFRYLAYVGRTPIGHAGMTLEDGVAKLWGGSVLEDYRGRGAYRALLRARLAEAERRGATLALVKARTGTSSPILRRAGFTAYGREVQYLLPPESA